VHGQARNLFRLPECIPSMHRTLPSEDQPWFYFN
jgi:hypothetical protein